MKAIWLAAGVLVAAACAMEIAQAQSITFSSDRWFYGGGVGVSFGDITYVEVSPLLGYRVDDRLSVGGSLIFRYRDDDRFSPSVNTSDYGGGLFARYTVVAPFFLQAEYEYLNYEVLRPDRSTERMNANSVFAGGGVTHPLNRNVSLFATVLYNLTYSSYDEPGPYSSPWVVRFGVSAGF
jgi:hypothetical protein